MLNTDAAVCIDVANTIAGPERRTRTNRGRKLTPTDRAPHVRETERDGVECLAVEVGGRLGEGKELLIDEADWPTAAAWSEWWTVSTMGGRSFIVCGRRVRHRDLSRNPCTVLARLLVGAKPGWVVRYRNDDAFDLRRRNLRLQTRRELFAEMNLSSALLRQK